MIKKYCEGAFHMSRPVDLKERQQFRILLNPIRQQIIRLLYLTGRPLSANTMAKWLNLSPMAAKGHLEKLAGLGLVIVQADTDSAGRKRVLYALDDVEIRLHLGCKDSLQGEREALAAELADAIFCGVIDTSRRHSEELLPEECLFSVGALHLSGQERRELSALISNYLDAHRIPSPETEEHWEFALIARRFREESLG